jgi:hypothetical protein
MKNLSYYHNRYRKAKTSAIKAKIMNGATMNLSHEDQQKFIAWQVNYMRSCLEHEIVKR